MKTVPHAPLGNAGPYVVRLHSLSEEICAPRDPVGAVVRGPPHDKHRHFLAAFACLVGGRRTLTFTSQLLCFEIREKCFGPNCAPAYRSCKDHVSLFKAPMDSYRRAAWNRAISSSDRKLQVGGCICEKLFSFNLISRMYYVEHDGKVLLKGSKRTALLAEAVPLIFSNCPKHMSVVSSKPLQKLPKSDRWFCVAARHSVTVHKASPPREL